MLYRIKYLNNCCPFIYQETNKEPDKHNKQILKIKDKEIVLFLNKEKELIFREDDGYRYGYTSYMFYRCLYKKDFVWIYKGGLEEKDK